MFVMLLAMSFSSTHLVISRFSAMIVLMFMICPSLEGTQNSPWSPDGNLGLSLRLSTYKMPLSF